MTNHTALLTAHQRRTPKAPAARATRTEIIPAPAQAAPATSSLVAGLLMATGIGWSAGLEARPFHPVMVGVSALVIHVLPLVAVLIVVVRGWRGADRGRGVTIAAVLALAFGAFSALFSVTHPHAQVGVHNVNDILPIAILVAGALLWLVRGRKTQRTDRPSA
jgi:hypothetical protein